MHRMFLNSISFVVNFEVFFRLDPVMAWCRVWLFFALLFHHYVGHIEARPQGNFTQQNVAGDITSDDGETTATSRTEVKKNRKKDILSSTYNYS